MIVFIELLAFQNSHAIWNVVTIWATPTSVGAFSSKYINPMCCGANPKLESKEHWRCMGFSSEFKTDKVRIVNFYKMLWFQRQAYKAHFIYKVTPGQIHN